jgi:hypothetical protein
MQVVLITAAVVGLVGCGTGAKIGGGKQGAAAALFAASSPTKSAGGLFSVLAQKLEAGQNLTVDCPHGGKASLNNVQISTGTNLSQTFTINYAGCGALVYDNPDTTTVEQDVVTLDGSMTVTQTFDFNPSDTAANGSVSQNLKGKITFSGAFSDFIDSDVTDTLQWAQLGTLAGQVTMSLNGHIGTSSDTFTYNNESVTVTAGVMVAKK